MSLTILLDRQPCQYLDFPTSRPVPLQREVKAFPKGTTMSSAANASLTLEELQSRDFSLGRVPKLGDFIICLFPSFLLFSPFPLGSHGRGGDGQRRSGAPCPSFPHQCSQRSPGGAGELGDQSCAEECLLQLREDEICTEGTDEALSGEISIVRHRHQDC